MCVCVYVSVEESSLVRWHQPKTSSLVFLSLSLSLFLFFSLECFFVQSIDMFEELHGTKKNNAPCTDSYVEWDFLKFESSGSNTSSPARSCVAPKSGIATKSRILFDDSFQTTPPSTSRPRSQHSRNRSDISSPVDLRDRSFHTESLQKDPSAFHRKRLSHGDESALGFLDLSHKYRIHHIDRNRSKVQDSDRSGFYSNPSTLFLPLETSRKNSVNPMYTLSSAVSDCLVDEHSFSSETVSDVPKLNLHSIASLHGTSNIATNREGPLVHVLEETSRLLEGSEVTAEDLLLTARSSSLKDLRRIIRQAKTQGGKSVHRWMVTGATPEKAWDDIDGTPRDWCSSSCPATAFSSAHLLRTVRSRHRTPSWQDSSKMASRGTSASTSAVSTARTQRDSLLECAPEILEIEARSPKLRYHSMRRIQSPSKTSRVSSARSGDSSLQEKISDDVSSSNASRLGSRISTSSVHYPGQHPRPSSGTFQKKNTLRGYLDYRGDKTQPVIDWKEEMSRADEIASLTSETLSSSVAPSRPRSSATSQVRDPEMRQRTRWDHAPVKVPSRPIPEISLSVLSETRLESHQPFASARGIRRDFAGRENDGTLLKIRRDRRTSPQTPRQQLWQLMEKT